MATSNTLSTPRPATTSTCSPHSKPLIPATSSRLSPAEIESLWAESKADSAMIKAILRKRHTAPAATRDPQPAEPIGQAPGRCRRDRA